MKSILILLSTYNGEKYLHNQLDSLYRQKDVDFHILVRDDGSKDDTVNILREYKGKFGKMTIIAEQNIGSKRSFYHLLQIAFNLLQSYDYYAFCDQDDVWDSDKISVAISALEASANLIKLYYCTANNVDAYLQPLPSINIVINETLASSIISPHSLGCTQVLNRALLEKVVSINKIIETTKIDEEYLPFHDSWVLISAQSLNGYVFFDKNPHIKYRQHSNNVIGGGSTNPFTMFRKRFERHMSRPHLRSYLAQLTLNIYSSDLLKEQYEVVDLLANYKKRFRNRMKFLFSTSVITGDFSKDIPLKMMILLGKF